MFESLRFDRLEEVFFGVFFCFRSIEVFLFSFSLPQSMFRMPIDQMKIYGLIGLGGSISVIDALIIRNCAPILYANKLRQALTYAASLPVGYGMLLCSHKLLGLAPEQLPESAAILSVTTLMIDGIALMFFPTVYENPSLKAQDPQSAIEFSRMGSAWLLWGVGVCFAAVFFTP